MGVEGGYLAKICRKPLRWQGSPKCPFFGTTMQSISMEKARLTGTTIPLKSAIGM